MATASLHGLDSIFVLHRVLLYTVVADDPCYIATRETLCRDTNAGCHILGVNAMVPTCATTVPFIIMLTGEFGLVFILPSQKYPASTTDVLFLRMNWLFCSQSGAKQQEDSDAYLDYQTCNTPSSQRRHTNTSKTTDVHRTRQQLNLADGLKPRGKPTKPT